MDLPLELRLRLFYDAYAAKLDRGELEIWPDFFTDDAYYSVTSRENFDRGLEHATIYCSGKAMLLDRVAAIRQSTVFAPRRMRHFVGGVHVKSAEASIHAEASFAVFESVSDSDPRVYMVGTYVDEVTQTPSGFLLRRRECVLDNARIYNSLIYPV